MLSRMTTKLVTSLLLIRQGAPTLWVQLVPLLCRYPFLAPDHLVITANISMGNNLCHVNGKDK